MAQHGAHMCSQKVLISQMKEHIILPFGPKESERGQGGYGIKKDAADFCSLVHALQGGARARLTHHHLDV